MPRIRSVKPEFFDDEEFVAGLTRDQRLYYVGLWVRCCDDRGAFPDSPRWIKKEVFPYDDDITADTIAAWNRHLIQLGRLIPYEVGGKRYLLVRHFLDHQKIDRPSKTTCHPIPPQWRFDEKDWRWIEPPEPLPGHGVEDSASTRRGLDEGSLLDLDLDQDLDLDLDLDHTHAPDGAGGSDEPPPAPPQTQRLVPYRAIADAWNEVCGDVLPQVRALSERRRDKLRARCRELAGLFGDCVYDPAWWRTVFERIRASPFCRGENRSGWRATLDWLIERRDAVAKVLEGHYDERAPAPAEAAAARAAPRDSPLRRYERLSARLSAAQGGEPP